MKIISQLNGVAKDVTWNEPRGTISSVVNEPISGFFRNVSLGHAGLVFRRGEKTLGIPLDDLFALAEKHEAAFVPPANPVAPEIPTGGRAKKKGK
jgi:hypothetical protein